jgi:hypothetical protein
MLKASLVPQQVGEASREEPGRPESHGCRIPVRELTIQGTCFGQRLPLIIQLLELSEELRIICLKQETQRCTEAAGILQIKRIIISDSHFGELGAVHAKRLL